MSGIGGISTLVLIIVLAFVIERVIQTILFLLRYWEKWTLWFPDPKVQAEPLASETANRKNKTIYYLMATAVALVLVVVYGKIRVLLALGYAQANPIIDGAVTVVVLIAGSELIAKVLHIGGLTGDSDTSQQPVEITGRLILENEPRQKQ